MSMFRAKNLDLGCFVNVKVIRDHTKRKVFQEHETERYDRTHPQICTQKVSAESIGTLKMPLVNLERMLIESC